MAKTRSMTRKLKNCITSDNDVSTDSDGSTSWANLNHDLLFLIMTYMGVFDFIAVSRVCKSWREVALDRWNRFMVSKQPTVLSISTRFNKKDLYLEDYSRRKLKTATPHSNGRDCLGVTCGYLIFYGRKTRDFWLVNPFTTKELYFPDFPFGERIYSHEFRGILVFSPSMSGWVFVVVLKLYTNVISFSLAGEQARWRDVFISPGSLIRDLYFFKGKLYMIDCLNHLWELRLNPEPTLTLLEMKNISRKGFYCLEFVSSGENLYVWDCEKAVFFEVDFDEMKWVNLESTVREYEVFVNHNFKCAAAIKPDTWTHPWTEKYERVNIPRCKQWPKYYSATMWYFPHECLRDHVTDKENGALLNVLKE